MLGEGGLVTLGLDGIDEGVEMLGLLTSEALDDTFSETGIEGVERTEGDEALLATLEGDIGDATEAFEGASETFSETVDILGDVILVDILSTLARLEGSVLEASETFDTSDTLSEVVILASLEGDALTTSEGNSIRVTEGAEIRLPVEVKPTKTLLDAEASAGLTRLISGM